jgi:hypothetical protein
MIGLDEMWVAKSVVLGVALLVAGSALAQAASRRDRGVPSYNNSTYGAAYPASPAAAAGSNGGYSADPHTRALQELADKYRPGW